MWAHYCPLKLWVVPCKTQMACTIHCHHSHESWKHRCYCQNWREGWWLSIEGSVLMQCMCHVATAWYCYMCPHTCLKQCTHWFTPSISHNLASPAYMYLHFHAICTFHVCYRTLPFCNLNWSTPTVGWHIAQDTHSVLLHCILAASAVSAMGVCAQSFYSSWRACLLLLCVHSIFKLNPKGTTQESKHPCKLQYHVLKEVPSCRAMNVHV